MDHDGKFPMGLVMIYVIMFVAGLLYVTTVNGTDSERIERCIKSAKCAYDPNPVN